MNGQQQQQITVALGDEAPGVPVRATEEWFQLLVAQVKDYAIILLDPVGRVVSWNAGAERIKGYRAGEILGQHFSRFYLPTMWRRGNRCTS